MNTITETSEIVPEFTDLFFSMPDSIILVTGKNTLLSRIKNQQNTNVL